MDKLSHPAFSSDYRFIIQDSLNLQDEEINLFLKCGHYDLLYTTKVFGEDCIVQQDMVLLSIVMAKEHGLSTVSPTVILENDKEEETKEFDHPVSAILTVQSLQKHNQLVELGYAKNSTNIIEQEPSELSQELP